MTKPMHYQRAALRVRRPRPMDTLEIGWLAGIIEGEGSFVPPTKGKAAVHIQVSMTDRDTIERLLEVTGEGNILGPYKLKREGTKPYWIWNTSDFAGTARVLLAIYPLLSERRKARLLELIEALSPKRLKGCGTNAGYALHRKYGETPCSACRSAHRIRSREKARRARALRGGSRRPGQGQERML